MKLIFSNLVTFKPIPNYTNYVVSNLGHVKNSKTNKFLKQFNTTGYYRVGLTQNNIKKSFLVHQLVAMAFLNYKPCKSSYIKHLNNNNLDNRLSNLEITLKQITNPYIKYVGIKKQYTFILGQIITRYKVQTLSNEILRTKYFKSLDEAQTYFQSQNQKAS